MERVVVPGGEGRAVQLAAGQRFRIVDVEGCQGPDVFAFCVDDVTEYASAEHTRSYHARMFPKVGQHFVTNRRRPILLYEQDDSPGQHDMLVAACDPPRYEALGVTGWHASCQENLLKSMAGMGFDRVEVPQPIILFTHIPIAEDGSLGYLPGSSKAGDSVTFRAELDCYLVVSSCPQDILPVNCHNPSPIAIELLRTEE